MKFPFVVFAASVLCGKPFAFYGNSFAVKTTPPTTANPDEVAQTVRKAVIALIPDASNPLAKGVVGYVEIKQLDKFSPVNITGQINGLPPNSMHGLHFHQNGAIFPNCTATGGHFNPKSTEHGAPTARIHHAGDLGNVLADVNGVINFNLKFDYITLFGGNSIVGRGLVLHEKIDDLGLGVGNLTATSKLTGNSGSRLCCGVVGLFESPRKLNQNPKNQLVMIYMISVIAMRRATIPFAAVQSRSINKPPKLSASHSSFQTKTKMLSDKATSIYDFKVKTLRGKEFDMAELKGKVVLIFNSASACGFTPQLQGLQSLHKELGEKGLAVIGFPTDDFKQETGTEDEIAEFCQANYGVSFPMMEKIHVNGSEVHPLYAYLKKEKKSLMMEMIKWNFEKFLIDRDGKVVNRYASTTTPQAIKADIEKLL